METIIKTVRVKNNQILVTLPKNFNEQDVQVVISTSLQEIEIPEWHIDIVKNRQKIYKENPSSALDFYELIKKYDNDI